VIPFDIALVRGISYKTDGSGEPLEAKKNAIQRDRRRPIAFRPAIILIRTVRSFSCWTVIPHTLIEHTKTDIFREIV